MRHVLLSVLTADLFPGRIMWVSVQAPARGGGSREEKKSMPLFSLKAREVLRQTQSLQNLNYWTATWILTTQGTYSTVGYSQPYKPNPA